MDNYVTGSTIRTLREDKKITQTQLGELIGVSDKTISKWENGRGLPDVMLLEPIAKALTVSVPELMTGKFVSNKNVSSNMLKSVFYVCPVCGNVIHSLGEALVSCHGIILPKLTFEEINSMHNIEISRVENEYFISIDHPMSKNHYISFIAYLTCDRISIIKLYPEQSAEARFLISGRGCVYAYCNHHGLFKKEIIRKKL